MTSRTKISTKVVRVIYPREGEDGKWYILSTEVGTVKGQIGWRPHPGEIIGANGTWGEYRGQKEFKAVEIWHEVPVNHRELLLYAAELTPGIGPATADKIWDALGECWQSIGDGDVPGVKGEKLAAFQETIAMLKLKREMSEAVAWLMGMGCTRAMAESAWELWEKSTISVVQADCYRLTDIPHYGFAFVDERIRPAFGIDHDDKRRVRAAVIYFMKQLADGGSTAIDWHVLSARTCEGANLGEALVADMVRELFEEGAMRGFYGSHRIAMHADYENELKIWKFAGAANA